MTCAFKWNIVEKCLCVTQSEVIFVSIYVSVFRFTEWNVFLPRFASSATLNEDRWSLGGRLEIWPKPERWLSSKGLRTQSCQVPALCPPHWDLRQVVRCFRVFIFSAVKWSYYLSFLPPRLDVRLKQNGEMVLGSTEKRRINVHHNDSYSWLSESAWSRGLSLGHLENGIQV